MLYLVYVDDDICISITGLNNSVGADDEAISDVVQVAMNAITLHFIIIIIITISSSSSCSSHSISSNQLTHITTVCGVPMTTMKRYQYL